MESASQNVSSSSAPSQYIGCFVSLISSNNGLRYEGVISEINLQDPSLVLRKVTCTEDIKKEGSEGKSNTESQVPPLNEVCNHMVFSASDIKDLKVISKPNQSIDCVVGHAVSIITREDVRVEGILTLFDVNAERLIMKEAYCYGGEGRKRRRRSEIPPCKQLSHPVQFGFKDVRDQEIIFIPEPQVEDGQSEFPPLTKTHLQH